MAEYRTINVDATVSNNIFNATADGQQVIIVDPYISIEQTDEGAVVTVTDTRGSTQATIYNGQDGADGVSPGVAVSSITGGHAVTITDEEHPTGQTFNVMDGQDGSDGQDGQDGVSPGVTITDFTGGHTVTITDADHPGGQSFNVFNGQNGIDGQDGAPGRDGSDGSDGSDGISPEVTISTITGGHRVNITDAGHPSGQDFDVMDGATGATGADGVSPAVTISSITGGHAVTIVDADHPSGQTFNVMDGEDGADAPIGLNITGASANDLIKVKTVDANGTPTAWEPAVVGTDYPDPATYGAQGMTVSNNPNIGTRVNSIMAVWESDTQGVHPLSISDNSANNLIVGIAVNVGQGEVCTLVGHHVTVQSQLKTLFPNLAPIIDADTNRVHSSISGMGNAAFGIGVNVSASQAAAAFGTTQRVTGNSSFTTGGMNYVSGQYSAACGRYLEATSNNQTVVGRANDNKSEDAFEVGNGSASASAVTRSNAFRVTTAGSAIAQTSLGIEDGQGNVVSVTASELSGIKSNTLDSASIDASGLISFKNGSTTVFTLQLPLYNGGIS